MKKPTYKLRGKVWLYPGDNAAWHFVTLPKKESKEIERTFAGILRRGFGSVRVSVTAGNTSWDTSIFPDKKRGAYLLPLKRSIREKENILLNRTLSYTIVLKDV